MWEGKGFLGGTEATVAWHGPVWGKLGSHKVVIQVNRPHRSCFSWFQGLQALLTKLDSPHYGCVEMEGRFGAAKEKKSGCTFCFCSYNLYSFLTKAQSVKIGYIEAVPTASGTLKTISKVAYSSLRVKSSWDFLWDDVLVQYFDSQLRIKPVQGLPWVYDVWRRNLVPCLNPGHAWQGHQWPGPRALGELRFLIVGNSSFPSLKGCGDQSRLPSPGCTWSTPCSLWAAWSASLWLCPIVW